MTSIGLLSPSGWGNLGDAGIQDAVIANLRARVPGARITGFTLNPPDTRKRHGIPAYPINGYEIIPGYGINFSNGDTAPASPVPAGEPGPATLKERLRRFPVLFGILRVINRSLSWVREPATLVLNELRHIGFALTFLEDCDLLIVSGGGQLDEEWGGPWGHPYVLAKWAFLARLQGVPMVFLSVGTCQVKTRAARTFLRYALHAAQYRSYREPDSRDRAIPLTGKGDDPVVPDLAFSLPLPERKSRPATGPRIGIFPMAYLDPRIWPTKDASRFRTYLETLSGLAAELARQGITVVWLYSDGADGRVVADVREILKTRYPGTPAGEAPDVEAVDRLLDVVRDLDIVVASRLHAVLLSYLVGTPALALSYDRKVDALMGMLAEDARCLPIDSALAAVTEATFALHRDRDGVRMRTAPLVAAFRRSLDRQLDTVLALRRSA